MKNLLKFAVFLLAASAAARAQVAPAATGGVAPTAVPANSNMHYALLYAQTAQLSSVSPTEQASTASGSFDYLNSKKSLPFLLEYAGGYTWTLAGPDYQSGQFHHMLISQGFDWGKTKFAVVDDVSYLPQSPTLGFSGVPGTGQPIGTPNPAPPSGQTILTVKTHVVNNFASGEYEHLLNYATTVRATAGYEVLRFPDGNGYDTDTLSATAEVADRLNGRNTVYGRYAFSQYSYPGSLVDVNSNKGLAGFRRKWTRNLSTDAEVGPEWIASSENAVVPSKLNFAADAAVLYSLRSTSLGASYSHGTNGGSGYFIGGEVDSVRGDFSRQLGQNLMVGLEGGFYHNAGLNTTISTNSSFGGVQSSWRAGRNLIFFVNYSAMNQSSSLGSQPSAGLPSNVANEMRQVFGFGFGFSPRVVRLGR